jgi:hypothetical protein
MPECDSYAQSFAAGVYLSVLPDRESGLTAARPSCGLLPPEPVAPPLRGWVCAPDPVLLPGYPVAAPDDEPEGMAPLSRDVPGCLVFPVELADPAPPDMELPPPSVACASTAVLPPANAANKAAWISMDFFMGMSPYGSMYSARRMPACGTVPPMIQTTKECKYSKF